MGREEALKSLLLAAGRKGLRAASEWWVWYVWVVARSEACGYDGGGGM